MANCKICGDTGFIDICDTSFGQHHLMRICSCHKMCPECKGSGNDEFRTFFAASDGAHEKKFAVPCMCCHGKKIVKIVRI